MRRKFSSGWTIAAPLTIATITVALASCSDSERAGDGGTETDAATDAGGDGATSEGDGGMCAMAGQDCSDRACCDGLECCTGVPAMGTCAEEDMCPVSDRNAKKNFAEVDSRAVLDRVAELDIREWSYKRDTKGVRHLGPMAQDFYAAFGLGGTKRRIFTVDADGVALAAIQALDRRVQQLQRRNQKLKTNNASLRSELRSLDERIRAIERNAGPGPQRPAER